MNIDVNSADAMQLHAPLSPDDLFGLKRSALQGLRRTLRPVKAHAFGWLVAARAELNASRFRKACLYVVPRGAAIDSLSDDALPAGITPAQEHCLTSDVTGSRRTGATAVTADRMIADRSEGRFLACGQSESGWFGVSKVPLTLCLSQGKDVLITDVPRDVIDVLRRVCADMLIVTDK